LESAQLVFRQRDETTFHFLVGLSNKRQGKRNHIVRVVLLLARFHDLRRRRRWLELDDSFDKRRCITHQTVGQNVASSRSLDDSPRCIADVLLESALWHSALFKSLKAAFERTDRILFVDVSEVDVLVVANGVDGTGDLHTLLQRSDGSGEAFCGFKHDKHASLHLAQIAVLVARKLSASGALSIRTNDSLDVVDALVEELRAIAAEIVVRENRATKEGVLFACDLHCRFLARDPLQFAFSDRKDLSMVSSEIIRMRRSEDAKALKIAERCVARTARTVNVLGESKALGENARLRNDEMTEKVPIVENGSDRLAHGPKATRVAQIEERRDSVHHYVSRDG